MSWHQAKRAVLAGEIDYSYSGDAFVIPTSDAKHGFQAHDRSRDNAYGTNALAPNVLPRNAQDLYKPHSNLDNGFAMMSDEFIRMDYAPFMRREKNMQIGILQTMVNRQPVAHRLVGNSAMVGYTTAEAQIPGNPIGTLDRGEQRVGYLQHY